MTPIPRSSAWSVRWAVSRRSGRARITGPTPSRRSTDGQEGKDAQEAEADQDQGRSRKGQVTPGGHAARRRPRPAPARPFDRGAASSTAPRSRRARRRVRLIAIGVPPGSGRHRLHLSVSTGSTRDEDCVGFTLDEPFADRRFDPLTPGCVRPRTGSRIVDLVSDHVTDDDLAFPSHTLVRGIPGGRCGPILELLGVCVVEQAGTTAARAPGPFGPSVDRPARLVPAAVPVPSALSHCARHVIARGTSSGSARERTRIP